MKVICGYASKKTCFFMCVFLTGFFALTVCLPAETIDEAAGIEKQLIEIKTLLEEQGSQISGLSAGLDNLDSGASGLHGYSLQTSQGSAACHCNGSC